MERIPYASATGFIMYAMLLSRLDVSYALSITSRYQFNPNESHWKIVKNILKYLRRTNNVFLVFWGNKLEVHGYSNANF
jgi:tRNA C32,U32 (ribose-2'-O)-methylase TrmJ